MTDADPFSEAELGVIRRAYARQLLATVEIEDPRLESAFAATPREAFLGPGPWEILRPRGYAPTPSADPVYLYADLLVGILPERGLNNGLPSFHARLMAEARVEDGEHVVHVGAGTGYYSAIFAHLAGPGGRVTAVELEPSLAEAATRNLETYEQVSVLQGDGATLPFEPADVIYVNAGATRPAERWLDGLSEGGRLVLPLTAQKTLPPGGSDTIEQVERHGAVFVVQRRGESYLARWVSPVGVYPCEGGRDEVSEAAIAAALEKGGWKDVTRLYRRDDVPEAHCWLKAPGWCLAYE